MERNNLKNEIRTWISNWKKENDNKEITNKDKEPIKKVYANL